MDEQIDLLFSEETHAVYVPFFVQDTIFYLQPDTTLGEFAIHSDLCESCDEPKVAVPADGSSVVDVCINECFGIEMEFLSSQSTVGDEGYIGLGKDSQFLNDLSLNSFQVKDE